LDTHQYTFVYPVKLIGLATLTVILTGLFWPAQRRKFLIAVLAIIVGLPSAVIYAMKQWPGGDDGCGMGWLFLVVPSSVLLALFTLTSGAIVLIWEQTWVTKVKIILSAASVGLTMLLLTIGWRLWWR
jgi:hypothetical protein